MTDEPTDPTLEPLPKKKPSGELSIISQEEARANKQTIILMSEQVNSMHAQLASVREMLQKLPGTIGAAVANALSSRPPTNASGPPVPLVPLSGDVEFGKGQAMKIGGQIVTEGIALPTYQPPKSKAKPRKS